ncbi:MAG: hypothetical protein KDD05_00220 [Psychroserpens sp.]|nr:hypothetical protein [Psychroserpens sp.]
MKYIFNFRLLFIAALLVFVSCDSKDDDTSFLNDRQSVAYFVPGSQATLQVSPDSPSSSFNVVVGVSEAKPFARSFAYTIDPTSVAVEGVDFTLSSTLEVPANSVVGTITVDAPYSASTLEGKALKLNLTSVEDSKLGNRIQFTLNIIRFCPLGADFTGEYMIDFVSGGVPAAGNAPALGTGIVVDLFEGDSPTERRFNVKCYPSFGFGNPPVDFSFDLICGSVLANGVLEASGVGCGGSISFGPAINPSTYNNDDDSTFGLTFVEDTEAQCPGSTGDQETVYTFTKQ